VVGPKDDQRRLLLGRGGDQGRAGGVLERQLLSDDQRRVPAPEDRGVEATLRLDGARRGPWHDDQIAEAPGMCHHRLDLADLLCPGRKAGIETPARGFRDVVPGSPVDEALLLLGSRFLRLALDYLARHSGSENYVGKVGEGGIRVRKDEQRANVRIHSSCQYESGVQKRFAKLNNYSGKYGPV
jgi:hypothetical protein